MSMIPKSIDCTVGSRAKVLFVSYTADWTGPTNSLLLLVKHLRNRYDVAVLAPGHGLLSEALAAENIPFFSLPDLTKRSIPGILRLIRREHFDLVYANTVHGGSRNALIAAKLAQVGFICHIRHIGSGPPWLGFSFLNFAGAVIAVSQACADSFRGRFPKRKLTVVHNGVEVHRSGNHLVADRHRLRQELGIPAESTLVINVGHVKPLKGQEYALQAVAESISRGADLYLALVGGHDRDAAYAGRIKTMIEELGLKDRVALTGFRKDIPALLRSADVYVHSSFEEAHPRAVLEAMEAGLPVVAFAVGGVLEAVEHGKTGYLVPPGDTPKLIEAMTELLANPPLREKMGAAGRQRAEECFSAEAAADKVAAVIDTQLKSGRATRG